MEKQKIIQVLKRCDEVFEDCNVSLKWIGNFLKDHPHIMEVPEELSEKVTNTQLDLFDLHILLENTLKSLGKQEENG